QGLTANASRLFVTATLSFCSLLRLATVAALFHNGQGKTIKARKSAVRSRLSAGGPGNAEKVHGRYRAEIPRTFLSALALCKVADPACHQCKRPVSWLIDKATRKR